MRILVINPNTTEAMTAAIGETARRVAAAGTVIDAVNPTMGPESVEGHYDAALATIGVLDEVRGWTTRFDAVVIACFDDTGLDAARTLTTHPVIGIGEAAYHAASFVAGGFSVITTLARSISTIENNLLRYGLATKCRHVRAANIGVLDLESDPASVFERISLQVAAAIKEDRAEAIVLGCAGMAGLASDLSREHSIPVVEGVAAAVKQAEALVTLGLRTSALGGYARPKPKLYAGILADFTPTIGTS